MVTFARRRKKHKSSEVCSASADLIGGNEDLIDKILLCLPARSLIRFKSVSKQWKSLISDPRFGLDHTLKNSSSRIPTGFFFYHKDFNNKHVTVHSVSLSKTEGKIPYFSHPIDKSVLKIVQSCNGLMLLLHKKQDYYVCNIVTQQVQFIPFPELYPRAGVRSSAWLLAFDPSVSSHNKILCIQQVDYVTHQFLIFSSETGQWKETGVTTCEKYLPKTAKGVYLQGAIYYLVTPKCYRFDIEAEKLTTISLPYRNCLSSLRYFGEFTGHLHLVYVRDEYAKRFRVFELDHVKQEWVVKYHVQINRLISRFPEVVEEVTDNGTKYAFCILSVVRGEKEEDSALIMHIPGKVVSYNLKSKKFEVLSELPLQKIEIDFEFRTCVFPFIPSLHDPL